MPPEFLTEITLNESNFDFLQAVVCHCQWGRGRTGTMLAAYMVKSKNMQPKEAIEYVRQKRPHSIETREQETAIHEYALSLKQ